MRYLTLVGILILCFGCTAVKHRDQIGTLIDYGKNQESQEKFAESETKNFNRAKESILKSKLVLGTPMQKVKKKLGSPVITDQNDNGIQWSYKAGNANWMKGEVVRLYFDESENLSGWKCKNFECPETGAE